MMVRPAAPSDASALEALGLPPRLERVQVAERDGVVVAAAGIDPAGTAAEPDVPLLVVEAAAAATRDEMRSAAEAVITDLRSAGDGPGRLLAIVDPLDYDATRFYDELGFRPTGRSPYRELGGGALQYISGYDDAKRSSLDLALVW